MSRYFWVKKKKRVGPSSLLFSQVYGLILAQSKNSTSEGDEEGREVASSIGIAEGLDCYKQGAFL
jgi:hypothetical protein